MYVIKIRIEIGTGTKNNKDCMSTSPVYYPTLYLLALVLPATFICNSLCYEADLPCIYIYIPKTEPGFPLWL